MSLKSKKMNLDYIRTFAVLGQSRNMTEASRKLEVDTSYVSRHIKQLEANFNTKLVLLDSKSKEMKFTETGKYLYEKYEKIYNEIILVEKNYFQGVETNLFKVSLGVSFDLENILLKDKLRIFTDKFPNINIKINRDSLELLWKGLLQYSYDFILCKLQNSYHPFNDNVIVRSLFHSNYCFFYNPEKYHFSNIEDSSFVIPISNTDERKVLNEYLKKNKLTFKRSYEINSFEQMLLYTKEGFGLGFALKETVEQESDLQIVELDCPCEVAIAYNKDNITPIVQELIDMY